MNSNWIFDPNNSDTIQDFYPNQSKSNFQSELIRLNLRHLSELIWIERSNRINPIQIIFLNESSWFRILIHPN